MTTWHPVSVSGLSSTGFMSSVGASPHASACIACARPISPPPAHTAELFDMFCDLKGATRTPARAKARPSAATTTLLPTSAAVPLIIRLFARRLFTRFRSRGSPSEIELHARDEIDRRRLEAEGLRVVAVEQVLHAGVDLLVADSLPLDSRGI